MNGILRVAKLLARAIYAVLKALPVRRKVVLISRRTSKTSIDFRLIQKYLESHYPEYTVTILNHKMTNKLTHAFDILIEMYHLATARAVIVDSYVISVSILNHKDALIIVQIWHALGAIKEFGHAVVGRREGSSLKLAESMDMHRNYTYVTAGAAATVPVFAHAFNVRRDLIKPIGMPRVDYLLKSENQQKAIQAVRKKYGRRVGDKEIILYAPTFRKRGKISPQKLIDAIDTNAYALIIKQHPNDKTKIRRQKGVILETYFDTLDLLPAVDYVVTDYSALSFEAALLGKPLFFWAYDRKSYAIHRGFALDYDKEMPGVISTRASEIAQAIRNKQYDLKKIRQFARKYVTVQDGTSTERIVKLLNL